ncbi:glycoside hydrolase family 16 protein [Vararia minispora EC-137]|uniref:Glycoside hydrolase family 16 protein n=1 Tax=Vararia minispora EC-137 TaxID=1314806 RepID=A0ACB8QJ50_9AGAM|nr:glycoside hydrolase family 16 protein [Vararia minispora EC-137]
MNRVLLLAIPLALSLRVANAQGGQVCNSTSPCPASAPCCSSFGFCGTNDFCMSGCNPLASNTLDSCRPVPVCQSGTHTFTDNSRIFSNATLFDGNATEYDWVVNQGNVMNTNSSGGELALLLTESNGGTRISSTRYVHYGTITATMKATKWTGVVTAFITMSGIKDEIDWEWPGNSTTSAQTNMFWQGLIPAKTIGETEDGINDTFGTYHDYTIDWQPDALTFLIDNKTVRTIQKSDTIDSNGVVHFPSTPSSIQLSVWPAGINSSAPGTIAWAGGMINWNDPDYQAAGHFYALIKSVRINCADPTTPGANVTSYVYGTNSSLDVPSIAFSNESVLVSGAFGATASFPVPTLMMVLALLTALTVL